MRMLPCHFSGCVPIRRQGPVQLIRVMRAVSSARSVSPLIGRTLGEHVRALSLGALSLGEHDNMCRSCGAAAHRSVRAL